MAISKDGMDEQPYRILDDKLDMAPVSCESPAEAKDENILVQAILYLFGISNVEAMVCTVFIHKRIYLYGAHK